MSIGRTILIKMERKGKKDVGNVMKYEVVEIFDSIQGEGINIGTPSTFIRLARCNLKCKWCDSKYSWEKGKMMTIPQILKKVHKYNVVITGGEPLLQNLNPLLDKLNKSGEIEIETNGTLFDKNIIKKARFNISPKFQYINEEVLKSYNWVSQEYKDYVESTSFKFVIEDKKTYNKAKELINKLNLENVIFMPEGIDKETILKRSKEISKWILKDDLNIVRIIPRLQILLWGNIRKT